MSQMNNPCWRAVVFSRLVSCSVFQYRNLFKYIRLLYKWIWYDPKGETSPYSSPLSCICAYTTGFSKSRYSPIYPLTGNGRAFYSLRCLYVFFVICNIVKPVQNLSNAPSLQIFYPLCSLVICIEHYKRIDT
jgi:hypothetical protein